MFNESDLNHDAYMLASDKYCLLLKLKIDKYELYSFSEPGNGLRITINKLKPKARATNDLTEKS